LFLFICYSTTLDNTDISTLGKGKALAFINGIEAYNKEILSNEIRRLIITNVQLMADKIKTKKAKVNLKADKVQLLSKKNSLVVKREKLRAEITTLYAAGPSNIPIRRYQDPLLKPIQNKLKAKRPPSFNSLKKNF